MFTLSTFGFLFNAFAQDLNINICKYHPVGNGKMVCFIIFKIKVCPAPTPLDPANLLHHRHIAYLHNVCEREAKSRGERYTVSQRRCVVRTQYGKMYSNDIENGVKIT